MNKGSWLFFKIVFKKDFFMRFLKEISRGLFGKWESKRLSYSADMKDRDRQSEQDRERMRGREQGLYAVTPGMGE